MNHSLSLFMAVSLGLAACRPNKVNEPPSPAANPVALPSGMCAEHGVLEAVCTKCKTSLIPVFRAKGDWCEEHGFPESFCPACHPERGGKPKADVATDDGPPDGTEVRLKSKDTSRLAGIVTVAAEERPGGMHVSAVVAITYDGGRWAAVNARSAGVVRTVSAEAGSRVRAGTVLATIESSALAADRSRQVAAARQREIAQIALARAKRLHDEGVGPWKDVVEAEQAVASAAAGQQAADAALRALGTGGEGSAYTVAAPISGTVTKRHTTLGQVVAVAEPLFEIADTTAMWAEIDLPEQEAMLVRAGQALRVQLDGLEGLEFTGTVSFVSTEVDRKTRTVKARAALSNNDGVLRANMFGTASIAVGDTRPVVLVPREALQKAKGVPIVFVRVAEDKFEARRVEAAFADRQRVEIRKGLRPGEAVVTEGSFALKTETIKDSIGAGCCGAD